MNKFTSRGKNRIIEFSTQEELLDNPWIKKFIRDNFNHFAIDGDVLLAIYDNGFRWLGLGLIEKPELVNLLQWEGWKFKAIVNSEVVVFGKDDVTMTCMGRIYLVDGRIFKKKEKGGLYYARIPEHSPSDMSPY